MNFENTASLLAVSSELFSKNDIITLPSNVKFDYQDVVTVMLHAATSSTNSLESASNDLIFKNSTQKIPSADTIFEYIKYNNVEDILHKFRNMSFEILKMMKLENTVQDIAIDFHDIPYYGDKNSAGVRGIKPKNGTSWGRSFCTLDIIGKNKLTLDVIDINGLCKNYSILIESLIERVGKIGVKIGTVFMDREFFNLDVISELDNQKVDYVIAAKSNKRIKRMLEEHENKYGKCSTVLEYKFQKGGPTFNIVAMYGKEKGYVLFATNKKVLSSGEFIKNVPEEYKKRWNIETGYRVKNDFKIRTCTVSPVARALFFVIQCIMYNILNMLKSVLKITAYELKSSINEEIIKILRYGFKSLSRGPVQLFLDCFNTYNREQKRVLRKRLMKI